MTRRHIDIRLLPSLVPEEIRNETAKVIEPELQGRIDKLKDLIDAGIIDMESSNGIHFLYQSHSVLISN